MMSASDDVKPDTGHTPVGAREAEIGARDARQAWLTNFVWEPRTELKKVHKDKLKRYWSLLEGRDGTELMCQHCKMVFGLAQIEVHHTTGRKRGKADNELHHLKPLCGPCNRNAIAKLNAGIEPDTLGRKQLNKEIDQHTDAEKLQQKLLLEAPTIFQKSKSYKRQFFDYMFEYLAGGRPYDVIVQEATAMIGCQKEWTTECLDVHSADVESQQKGSHFLPFVKEEIPKLAYTDNSEEVQIGSYTRVRPNPAFDIHLASPEYVAALKEYQQRKKDSSP